MLKVNAKEFQRHFGQYQDKALMDPIVITRNGRERLVLLSSEEYKRLRDRAREVLLAEDLTEEDLAAIEQTKMSSRHDHLNKELY